VKVPVLRLLTISLFAAAALPVAPAMAGWRDGYYADYGWDGGYYPPAYVPQPDYDQGYRRPWGDRRAYYDNEESVYGAMPDEDYRPVTRPRVPRPPRNVEAALPYAAPARPRIALPQALPPKKPKTAVAAPANKPVVAQAPLALPTPRPNLESMDFDQSAPAPQHLSANEAQR
jgi:hypothetical protein